MNSQDGTTEHEVEAVMQEAMQAAMTDARRIQPVSDLVRARVLARARGHLQATSGAVPAPLDFAASPWRGRRLAFAAAMLLGFSTAGAAAALYTRGSRSPAADLSGAPAAEPAAVSPRSIPALPAVSTPAPLAESPPSLGAAPPLERSRRPLSAQESYAAELALLQRAHSDYNARAFRDTLALLAEHARRFPGGRLAEEREALRVRSLEASGRPEEARRALVAFGKRFPRSALLPRLRQPHPAEP